MLHFNKLTPAEAERLAILSEELGEAVQSVGKILRHGFESKNPLEENSKTNRQKLEEELGDVLHAIDRLRDGGDVSSQKITTRTAAKKVSIERWLHHQKPQILDDFDKLMQTNQTLRSILEEVHRTDYALANNCDKTSSCRCLDCRIMIAIGLDEITLRGN